MDDNIRPEPETSKDFRKELAALINSFSLENSSDTPDFILADYLQQCLRVFDITVARREQWYGREIKQDKPQTVIPAE